MTKHAHSDTTESLWPQILKEAQAVKENEPALAAFVQENILLEDGILAALAQILSSKLATPEVSRAALHTTFKAVYKAAPELEQSAKRDLVSYMQNDPAVHDPLTPFLFYKGYHALQTYRITHKLWQKGRRHLALHLQNRLSELVGVDIHPAATIGDGIMFDHASGIVVGETSTIEDDVLIWHGVTLGSKSPHATGNRHPKVRKKARIGANATILGAVEIGVNARVAAGSMVLEDVPAGAKVAGVPAKLVKQR